MPTSAASKRTRRLLELVGICLAAALMGIFVFPRLELAKTELNVQDKIIAWTGLHPSTKEFVFVAIDDASMKLDQLWPEDIAQSPSLQAMSAGWPWPRTVYADASERILAAGAKLVIFDLILDATRPGDEVFKATLDRHPRQILIGANLSFDALDPAHPELRTPAFRMPSPSLISHPDEDARVGFVNFLPQDRDLTIRSALYGLRAGARDYQSLSAAAVRLLAPGIKIPATGSYHLFRYAHLADLKVVPFYSLFLPTDWKQLLRGGEVFRDKVVVIGPSAAILHDVHLTPDDIQLPGPLLHVNAVLSLLNGTFYTRAGPLVCDAYVLIAACVAWTVSVRFRRRPIASLATLLATFAFFAGLAFACSQFFDYLLPVVQPGATLLVAGVGCFAWNFARERRESGRMRSMLERYVSRNLVREVLDHRDDFLSKLGGTRQPVTVLFSDVRGFTSFSEREDASAVVEQLNEYLGEMVGVIFRRHGTVDKFMGDGIMAVWGNVVSEGSATDARHAVATAWEMLERLDGLNARWAERELRPFAVGIGLHHGEAVFGNIGSAEKMEPTVIGDTVNLASRVEGLTKKYGIALCITQPLAELVSEQFLLRTVDLVQVVGKSRPVEILTVVGPRATAEMPPWMKRYEGAVADFRARRFAEAAEALRICVAEAPGDKLCALYLKRSETFLAEPPPEDWTGTEIATSK